MRRFLARLIPMTLFGFATGRTCAGVRFGRATRSSVPILDDGAFAKRVRGEQSGHQRAWSKQCRPRWGREAWRETSGCPPFLARAGHARGAARRQAARQSRIRRTSTQSNWRWGGVAETFCAGGDRARAKSYSRVCGTAWRGVCWLRGRSGTARCRGSSGVCGPI